MPGTKQGVSFICARCLHRQSCLTNKGASKRLIHSSSKLLANAQAQAVDNDGGKEEDKGTGEAVNQREPGAMSRRLEEMTSESLESNPRRAQKMVEESGFSDELKARLEARIAHGTIKSEHPEAFAIADLPDSADKGARETAAALPWSGTERLEDAALRMLEDAHKPLKPEFRRTTAQPLMTVDMRMKKAAQQSGAQRLANARDKSSVYALSQDINSSEKEKEKFREELKERFKPGGRPMPQSISGLQSLASERIEDAIARGLFKNIPRGKGVNVERDHVADSPFLDTTEYFMNKIIQRQDILPPWVEKQQEVARQAAQFRGRLRNDWKRHAARTISSEGGTLQQQVTRAEAYAKAEEQVNPRKAKEASMTTIDTTRNLKNVTVTETPVAEQGAEITVTQSTIDHATSSTSNTKTATVATTVPEVETPPTDTPAASHVFRDPQWEATELSYHTLALESLNSLTRSYNLMAPELAKKPYFSLRRELKSCFADIAPLLPNEIKERARAPPSKSAFETIGHRPGGVLERFGGQTVRVYESKKPTYGFKEFWNDVWGNKSGR